MRTLKKLTSLLFAFFVFVGGQQVSHAQSALSANLTTNVALPANTYANGASGVGATLTANANAALTVDGTAAVNGNLIAVKNETTLANNGLYTVTAAGSGAAPYVLTRVTSMDQSTEFTGSFVVITSGSVGANSGWNVTCTSPCTVGTSAIQFFQNGTIPPIADTPWNNFKITNLGTPISSGDATNKSYVDTFVQGLETKAPVRLATTAALAANTYNNGVLGIGATLTETGNGVLTVDGTAVAALDRVLVKNEVTTANNGIYVVTQAGSGILPYILTRSSDMNTASEFPGAYVLTLQGTTNQNTGWTLVADPDVAFVVGTTAQTWNQFTGAGDIIAGNGITKSGNTLSVATTLPDNYTFSAAGTSATFNNNVLVSGTFTAGSIAGSSGSGAVALGSMTGDFNAPTGQHNWAGASGKTLSLQSTAANMTIQTLTSGALFLDSAGALNLCGSFASSCNIGRTSITAAVAGPFSIGQNFVLGNGTNGTLVPTSLSSNQTDYTPLNLNRAVLVRQDCSAAVTINSLQNQTAGTYLIWCNISGTATNTQTFLSDDGSTGTAAMRIKAPANTNFVLKANACVPLLYDGSTSRWRIMSN